MCHKLPTNVVAASVLVVLDRHSKMKSENVPCVNISIETLQILSGRRELSNDFIISLTKELKNLGYLMLENGKVLSIVDAQFLNQIPEIRLNPDYADDSKKVSELDKFHLV